MVRSLLLLQLLLPPLLLPALSAAAAAPAAPQRCDIVAEPPPSLLSLAAAADAVAAQMLAAADGGLDRDLVVCVRRGVHAAPLSLARAHAVPAGARGRVVWRGEAGAVISGGEQVQGWAPSALFGGDGSGNNVFVAAVPPRVAAANSVVRQLYVAGARARRTSISQPAAALGGLSLWVGADGLSAGFVVGDLPPAWLNNSAAIEFVWPTTLFNWIEPRCTAATVEPITPSPKNMTGPLAGVSVVSNSGVLPGRNGSGVVFVANFSAVGQCTDACASAAWCTSYTWHDATCGAYAFGCYARTDGDWEPQSGFAGHYSGDKLGGGNGNITLASPCGALLLSQGRASPGVIEAAAPLGALPLPPGTFFHDRDGDLLYYALSAGQAPADLEASAWVPAEEVLLEAENLTGHVFEGVAFEYSAWSQVNTGTGFVDQQAAVFFCDLNSTSGPPCETWTPNYDAAGGSRPFGARSLQLGVSEPLGSVRVSGGADLVFTNCSFAHLGAAYALSIVGGSQRATVANCTFSDLSGGFVRLGSVAQTTPNAGSDTSTWDAGHVVSHNVARDMSIEYQGAPGAMGGFLFDSELSHNDIERCSYSGVSWGWGWGRIAPQGVGSNRINFNRISSVMTGLKDGGGIYVLGTTNASLPSEMAFNYVTNDEAVFAVYYVDNGSNAWHVHHNVVDNATQAWAVFFTSGGAHGESIDPAPKPRTESPPPTHP